MKLTGSLPRKAPRQRPLKGEVSFLVMRRALALAALFVSIGYMARLLGIGAGGAARFDLLPVPWRIAVTGLALLYAGAGFGLWQLMRWGFVVWAFAAACEIVMHTVYGFQFGFRPLLVAFNASVLAAYLALAGWLFWQERARARQNR